MLADMGIAITLLGFSGVADVVDLEDLPVRTVEIAPRVVQRVTRRPSDGSAVARAVPCLAAAGLVYRLRSISPESSSGRTRDLSGLRLAWSGCTRASLIFWPTAGISLRRLANPQSCLKT
jgi:hypothetical protein